MPRVDCSDQTNPLRKRQTKHPDIAFCTSAIRSLEEIAMLLGPHEVTFLCRYAKARVPIGLTAANKQVPLMMHIEYKVRLPDHDFVKAPGHNVFPDVYVGVVINPAGNFVSCPKAESIPVQRLLPCEAQSIRQVLPLNTSMISRSWGRLMNSRRSC